MFLVLYEKVCMWKQYYCTVTVQMLKKLRRYVKKCWFGVVCMSSVQDAMSPLVTQLIR